MYTPGWGVVPGEVATAVKFSQLGANDDYLNDRIDKSVATGTIVAFVAATPPAGWLLCDGSAVSRTTYAALFAVLGTSRGAGDGSTTFNLPNLRGKTIVGVDPSDTDLDTAGKQFGAKNVTLLQTQMPQHYHTGYTSTDGYHSHNFPRDVAYTDDSPRRTSSSGGLQAYGFGGLTTNGSGSHNHSFTTDNRGGNQAHNNMQPSDAEYMIIKY